MDILVDENIPRMTVRALRAMGHDVLDIRDTAEKGVDDDWVWTKAQQERRPLITTDKAFVQHRDDLHHGILVVRLQQPNRQRIHQRVMHAMAQFGTHRWPGLLVVMRDTVQTIWRGDAVR